MYALEEDDLGETGRECGLSANLPDGSCLIGGSESVLDFVFGKERDRSWLGCRCEKRIAVGEESTLPFRVGDVVGLPTLDPIFDSMF